MRIGKKIKQVLLGESFKKKEESPGIVLISFQVRGEDEFSFQKKRLPIKQTELG
jgi:hypothetical protein